MRSSSPCWRPIDGADSRVSDTDDLAVAADRDAQHPDPLADHGEVDLALDDLAVAERAGHQRPLGLVEAGPDPVAPVHGLARGGPHLGQHDELAAAEVADRGEQQEVGEAEVGQQPPRRRQPLEVLGLAVRRAG